MRAIKRQKTENMQDTEFRYTSSDLVLPPKYSRIFFRLSHLFIISGSVALYRKHYDFFIVNGMWYITSSVYWYNPHYDYKQTLDYISVNGGIAYQVYRGINSSNATILNMLLCLMGLCYYFSWKYHHKQDYAMGTYLHCCVHIIGFIINLIFYSGCIDNCT